MKKIQQFYILKINSSRVIQNKYKIKISFRDAVRNGEIVSVAQNQVIESLMKLLGRKYDPEMIKELFIEKRKLKKKESSKENIERLKEIENKIQGILYIPEILSLKVDKKQQYGKVVANGIMINGRNYVRLLCGAGHARRNSSIWILEELEKPLKEILNNGRNLSDPIVLAKNNAYFALSFSGKLNVQKPYFCVIPDYEIKRKEVVDFVDDNMQIHTEERELDFNIWDGMGLISPRMAEKWAYEDLELDYVPSAFIVRNSFMKGMLAVFDFHKFSDECGKHKIKDTWGNDVNVRDMDVILTASQFKAWSSYLSCRDYEDNCKKNAMEWGVVRVTPKKEKDVVYTNYQFLQVLNLDAKDIDILCHKTINFLDGVAYKNPEYAKLYLMGDALDEYDDKIYSKTHDNVAKALMLNNDMLKDPYVQKHIIHSLNKKIKESYMGKLIVDGNFSMMVSDPYAFAEYMFGLPVKGLLSRDQHYNGYLNRKGKNKAVALRAPLTWRSEVVKMNLVKEVNVCDWYKHLDTGVVIYNVHGCDCMLHADAD